MEDFVDDSLCDGVVETIIWSCGGQRQCRMVSAAIVCFLLSFDLALAKKNPVASCNL